jgi:hypothetical protein
MTGRQEDAAMQARRASFICERQCISRRAGRHDGLKKRFEEASPLA